MSEEEKKLMGACTRELYAFLKDLYTKQREREQEIERRASNGDNLIKLCVNKMKMDDSISHLSGSCFTVYRTCRTEFDSSVVILTEASFYPHHL